jgi:uncharacterized membrane protein YqiK
MDSSTLIYSALGLVAVFIAWRLAPRLVRIDPEQALIRNRAHLGSRPAEVFFDRAYIVPAFDIYEVLDLSIQTLQVSLRGREGVHCRDNLRADVSATMHLKVPHSPECVILAAQQVGCSGVSDPKRLRTLFEGKFLEAIKLTFKQLDFEEILIKRDQVRDSVIDVIGVDLNGFQLEDVSLESIEQTPIEQLDPENILDAEGITKITDRTATQHVATNKIRRTAEKQVAHLEKGQTP